MSCFTYKSINLRSGNSHDYSSSLKTLGDPRNLSTKTHYSENAYSTGNYNMSYGVAEYDRILTHIESIIGKLNFCPRVNDLAMTYNAINEELGLSGKVMNKAGFLKLADQLDDSLPKQPQGRGAIRARKSASRRNHQLRGRGVDTGVVFVDIQDVKEKYIIKQKLQIIENQRLAVIENKRLAVLEEQRLTTIENKRLVVLEEKRIIEEKRVQRELEKELKEIDFSNFSILSNDTLFLKRIKDAEILRLENLEKLAQIQKDLESQQNSFIDPILVENLFKDDIPIISNMGKPKSVFNTQEKNIVPEIVTPVSRTNKPFIQQKEFSQNQTSIADITKDLSADLENFLPDLIPDLPIFKNDETEIKNVSYQVTPLNFKVVNGRIIGSVNISSSELTNEKTVLHASFFPLDLKQNKFGEKINTLNFNKDLNETIEINESSKNYENISMNLHVMNPKTKEHLSQEVNIDVLKSDSQDMPEKETKDNKMIYIVGGIGLIALALIVKKMRKGDKN